MFCLPLQDRGVSNLQISAKNPSVKNSLDAADDDEQKNKTPHLFHPLDPPIPPPDEDHRIVRPHRRGKKPVLHGPRARI